VLAKLEGNGGLVLAAKFNPAGTRIATVGCDNMEVPTCQAGSLRLWDANGSAIGVVEAYRFGSGFDFNPTGTGMIVGSAGNTARLLDANSKTIAVLSGHTAPINTTFFSPDGARILTASEDGTARLWDAKGNLITTLSGHTGPVWALFSPDGAHIITYSADHTARVWDAEGHVQTVLTGHTAAVRYVSINRTSTRILSESADGTTRLWTMAGKLITLLGTHTQKVEMSTFNPAGTQILTVDCDEMNDYDWCVRRVARLWDTEGKLIAIIDTHWVERAIFSPDGTHIATVGCDELDPRFHMDCLSGGVWLWKAYPSIEVMLAEANRRAGRALTPNECRQFLRVEQCP
jgi:WD40 repeat protein